MKKTIIIVTLAIVYLHAYSQQADSTLNNVSSFFFIKADSTTGLPILSARPQPDGRSPVIYNRGNISIVSAGLSLSAVENEIAELESQECNAVWKRDHAVLQRLWARDFTLDKKQNELVNSSNALPAYLSYSRIVERVTTIDSNTVFTSVLNTFRNSRMA